jgi:hypothetical protein
MPKSPIELGYFALSKIEGRFGSSGAGGKAAISSGVMGRISTSPFSCTIVLVGVSIVMVMVSYIRKG